jgi:hypothetical protein
VGRVTYLLHIGTRNVSSIISDGAWPVNDEYIAYCALRKGALLSSSAENPLPAIPYGVSMWWYNIFNVPPEVRA